MSRGSGWSELRSTHLIVHQSIVSERLNILYRVNCAGLQWKESSSGSFILPDMPQISGVILKICKWDSAPIVSSFCYIMNKFGLGCFFKKNQIKETKFTVRATCTHCKQLLFQDIIIANLLYNTHSKTKSCTVGIACEKMNTSWTKFHSHWKRALWIYFQRSFFSHSKLLHISICTPRTDWIEEVIHQLTILPELLPVSQCCVSPQREKHDRGMTCYHLI